MISWIKILIIQDYIHAFIVLISLIIWLGGKYAMAHQEIFHHPHTD